ncbi:MAG: NAD-dependent epimerase/dehydratase family protein, partial [Candidatus Pacebacteria bacterium]|nr:NAD-dependent epimerase/dehydratase family protein [Candidatus Paceibacterota bacterium]
NFTLQLSLFDGVRQHCPQARILVVGRALEYQPQKRPLKETDPLGPVNPYGVSKVLQDVLGYAYARSYQLKIIRCRPFNHIGERQAPGFAIPDFSLQIAQIENNSHLEPVIQVGNLDAIRDFTDVKDVVRAYSLLMSHGQVGQAYNIGSGQGYTIKHMLNQLLALSQRKISIETDPQKFRPLDVAQVIADNSKIKQLGWEPQIKIQQTLQRVLNYYRENIDQYIN